MLEGDIVSLDYRGKNNQTALCRCSNTIVDPLSQRLNKRQGAQSHMWLPSAASYFSFVIYSAPFPWKYIFSPYNYKMLPFEARVLSQNSLPNWDKLHPPPSVPEQSTLSDTCRLIHGVDSQASRGKHVAAFQWTCPTDVPGGEGFPSKQA